MRVSQIGLEKSVQKYGKALTEQALWWAIIKWNAKWSSERRWVLALICEKHSQSFKILQSIKRIYEWDARYLQFKNRGNYLHGFSKQNDVGWLRSWTWRTKNFKPQ